MSIRPDERNSYTLYRIYGSNINANGSCWVLKRHLFWSQSIILACISDKGWRGGSKSWANVVENLHFRHGTAVAILNSINLNDISGFIIFLSQHFLFISTWPGVFFPSTAFRCLAILAPPNHDWQWKYWHDWSTGRKPHRVAKDEGNLYGLLVPKMRRGPVEPTRNAGFCAQSILKLARKKVEVLKMPGFFSTKVKPKFGGIFCYWRNFSTSKKKDTVVYPTLSTFHWVFVHPRQCSPDFWTNNDFSGSPG